MEVLDEVKITKAHRWYRLEAADVLVMIVNLILLLISYPYFFDNVLSTARFSQLVPLQLYVTLPLYILYMIYYIWGEEVRKLSWGAAIWNVFIARLPNLILYVFAIATYLLVISLIVYFLMEQVDLSIIRSYVAYIENFNLIYYTKITALVLSNICFMFFNNSVLVKKTIIQAKL